MTQLTVEIPDELETEFKRISKIDLSILISKTLKIELAKMTKIKKIISKSKLKPHQADELANKVSENLAKHYASKGGGK